MATEHKAELLLATAAKLGEGALWDDRQQCLWWVDISGQTLHRFAPATGQDRALPVGAPIGTVVPLAASNEVLIAHGRGLAWVDFAAGTVQPLPQPSPEAEGHRLNDGKCDPQGRLWVGGLDQRHFGPTAGFHSFSPNGRWTTHLTGITCSNGLAWNATGDTLFYIDTPTGWVEAFDFDAAAGRLSRRRGIYEVPAAWGKPDGMTIDAADHLWVCLWGGGRVLEIDPAAGRLVSTVFVPATQVTSCAFGGPQLRTLYITTARHLSAEALAQQPLAGGLFVVQPGAVGVPANRFAGSPAALAAAATMVAE